ncbi:hypothetical protein HDU67_006727 [Dinochytrium kinnereticum]|nr:hypothetical protein HDU67_006727 [Dinochytrium kinnereticum]
MSCRFFPDGTTTRVSQFVSAFQGCANACLREDPNFAYSGFSDRAVACFCATQDQYDLSLERPNEACSRCEFLSFDPDCEDGGLLLSNVRALDGRVTVTTTAETTTTTTTSSSTTSITARVTLGAPVVVTEQPTLTSGTFRPTLRPATNPSTTVSPTGGSSQNSDSSAQSSASNGLSTAAIVGIVFALLLLIMAAVVGILAIQRRRKAISKTGALSTTPPPSWSPTSSKPSPAGGKGLISTAGGWFKGSSKPKPTTLTELLTPSNSHFPSKAAPEPKPDFDAPLPPVPGEQPVGLEREVTVASGFSDFTSATHPLERGESHYQRQIQAAGGSPPMPGTIAAGGGGVVTSVPTHMGTENEGAGAYAQEAQQAYYDPAYYQQYGYYQQGQQGMDSAQWAAHAAYYQNAYNNGNWYPAAATHPAPSEAYDPSMYQQSWAPSVPPTPAHAEVVRQETGFSFSPSNAHPVAGGVGEDGRSGTVAGTGGARA